MFWSNSIASQLTLWLDDLGAGEVNLVGPKAAALAMMARARLPVPAGFCLTVEATRHQLQVAKLEPAERRLVEAIRSGDEWRRAANDLREALLTVSLTDEIRVKLQEAFAKLRATGATLVAVRSSAVVEDRPGAGFAGQFATFLGVAGCGELIAAVRACWASRWSDRAIVYAQTQGLESPDMGMAVIVQALVQAEAAGSALSADPVSAAQSAIVVNGAWGLGRAVAEGEVLPDLWRLELPDLAIVERRIGHKPIAAFVAPEGGEVWQRQPADRANAACLDDTELKQLGLLVTEVEQLFGGPRQVEWALAAGELWLLQARPVTVRAGTGAQHARDQGFWVEHGGSTGPGFEAGRMIEGHATSPGRVLGRARLVRHPEDMALVQPGDILVTTFMRPSMTALLQVVAGLVVEAGGSTSHSANLARERQIPAIMGALGATRVIPDGALLFLDGAAGRAWCEAPTRATE